MDNPLLILQENTLPAITLDEKNQAVYALESGKVIYLPNYYFHNENLNEEIFSEKILDGKHKNISYDIHKQRLGGFTSNPQCGHLHSVLQSFMHNFACFARQLIDNLLPLYSEELIWGRTSYRPAEIKGRASSKRKDDTRLHVDSFPATPVHGNRILRIFCNINPFGQTRNWHLGEPFPDVAERFSGKLPAYNPNLAKLMHLLKITKSVRSAYDHYQLHIHDQMKLDDNYQQSVNKFAMNFKAQSTWIVFTDQVSHAALSGQFLLEQTFYLPVSAMAHPQYSPWTYWEKHKAGQEVS